MTLAQAIIATVHWFDQFSYPLTAQEIGRYLVKKEQSFTDHEFLAVLDSLVAGRQLASARGFYCLHGRESLVDERLNRNVAMEVKMRKVKFVCRILRYVPGLRLVAVCNGAGYFNGRPDSDVDIFIIVRQGNLWSVRALVTFILTVLSMRVRGEHAKDKLCLSFWMSDDNLSVERFALLDGDPYLAWWVSQVYPMLDDGVYREWWIANQWIKEYIQQPMPVLPSQRYSVQPSLLMSFSWPHWLELFFRSLPIQKSLFLKRYKDRMKVHGSIVITDNVLKLHDNDRREFYRGNWRARLTL
ncbi:MAG: hypothetical protein V1707_02965 [bacterium]